MTKEKEYVPVQPRITENEAIAIAKIHFRDEDYDVQAVRHTSDACYYQEIGRESGGGNFMIVFSRQSIQSPPLDLVTINVNDQTGRAERFQAL